MSAHVMRFLVPVRLSTRNNVNLKIIYRLCTSSYLNNQCLSVPATFLHKTQPRNQADRCKHTLLLRNLSMDSTTGDININYEQLIELKNNDNITIIDVREKDELRETGEIPGSFNIPLGDIAQALTNLNGDEFKRRYGFPKPAHEDKIVFSCRSGKRSLMALTEATKAGYTNSLNFSGGWLSWEENTNKK